MPDELFSTAFNQAVRLEDKAAMFMAMYKTLQLLVRAGKRNCIRMLLRNSLLCGEGA